MNKTFLLPDLGEGLPDATIVEWLVHVGDVVALDAPLASMETAKAVVEVPSPYAGRIVQLCGAAGDVIETGAPLVEFDVSGERATAPATAASAALQAASVPPAAEATVPARVHESTSVVGGITASNEVRAPHTTTVGGVRALPAVRAMAKKLKVDLAHVTPTGAGGVVTMADVKNAAAGAPAIGLPAAPAVPAAASTRPDTGALRHARVAFGTAEPLAGVRRSMARAMADAHARVVATTTMDDADLHAWLGSQDITVRLVRAIVAAARAVPLMNAWFDDEHLALTRHEHVDLGIAVDSLDGLFVPTLRNADRLDPHALRQAIDGVRRAVMERTIAPAELTGQTLSLSNYGMLGGRYATPILVPPCVAIVGAGRVAHDVVAVLGGIEVHRRLPLSITFDHRVATGGDAARFVRALIADLELPQ